MRVIEKATTKDKDEILKLYKSQLGRKYCPWNENYPSMETIDFDLSRDALLVMREGGKIIAYDANPFVNRVIEHRTNVITFGYNSNSTYCVKNVHFGPNGMPDFDICYEGETLGHVRLNVPGEHNILNATAAFACCHQLGVCPESMIETLEAYHGTQRRFDILGTTSKGVLIVDDYAHHPTEIKATLSASQNIPHKKLWCLFQPHTYTRTLALFDDFAEAFERADVLVLAEIYAAREKNMHKVSSKELAEKIKVAHPEKDVCFIDSFEGIAKRVAEEAEEGDLVLTMGAGDIYIVGEMIMEASK